MWNPLAALPASNIGALSSYQPQTPQAPAVPGMQPRQRGLHGLYGGAGGDDSMVHAMGDPNGFQAAMKAWHTDRPDLQRFDPQAAMLAAQGGTTPFDPRMARMQWQQDQFAPWRQDIMDWRQARPMRMDF